MTNPTHHAAGIIRLHLPVYVGLHDGITCSACGPIEEEYALHLARMLAQADALHQSRATIEGCVAELRGVHRPMWASLDGSEVAGKDPIGCVTCFPADGDWPCISAEVADDLAVW